MATQRRNLHRLVKPASKGLKYPTLISWFSSPGSEMPRGLDIGTRNLEQDAVLKINRGSQRTQKDMQAQREARRYRDT